MTSFRKDVAFRRTADDYCKARDDIKRHMLDAQRSMDAAEEISNSFLPYGWPSEAGPRYGVEHFMRELDSRWWRSLFDLTGLPKLMDAKAIDEFKRALGTDKMPEFTIGNIEATFLSMYQQRDEFFARGVYEVFRKIHRWKGGYRTNDKQRFAIGQKVIITFACETCWNSAGVRVRYDFHDTLNDIDRCFRVLGELPYEPGGLKVELDQHFYKSTAEPFESELYKIRAFRNGNIHVWFKRLDLLDRVNDTIAAYCGGNAIPEDAA